MSPWLLMGLSEYPAGCLSSSSNSGGKRESRQQDKGRFSSRYFAPFSINQHQVELRGGAGKRGEVGWVTKPLSKSQHNPWLCSGRPWPAASYCSPRSNILTKISLSAFFRSFWVLFNSSFVFSNSETVFCSCRTHTRKQQSAGYNM